MKIASAVILALLLAASAYYFFFYPPHVLKGATKEALSQFEQAVQTKDRAKIGAVLSTLLTDDAKIHLSVSFLSITAPDAPAVVQDFDKTNFIAFIDNVLYPLTDYDYRARLETFALADDGKTAAVTFTFRQWADGNEYYGGNPVAMRYSAEATCSGQAAFENKKARLAQVTCKINLRAVPKPEEIGKMRNMDAIQDLLKH